MSEEFPISQAGVDGWNLERVGDIGLYWKASTDRAGFQFVALDWTAFDSAQGDPWTAPGLMVQNMVRGTAYFDGIRHIDFGSNGYFNYPHVEEIAKLFHRLRELELEHCWDADRGNVATQE